MSPVVQWKPFHDFIKKAIKAASRYFVTWEEIGWFSFSQKKCCVITQHIILTLGWVILLLLMPFPDRYQKEFWDLMRARGNAASSEVALYGSVYWVVMWGKYSSWFSCALHHFINNVSASSLPFHSFSRSLYDLMISCHWVFPAWC